MSYNVPVRHLQGGSVLEVAPSGTINILAGGSIQNAGAMAITGALSAPGITLGGTFGRWAFGTVGIASGVGTIATGFSTVFVAQTTVISGVQGGAGSMSSVVIDDSLFNSGSVIFRGLAGTLAFTGSNGTLAWFAVGR